LQGTPKRARERIVSAEALAKAERATPLSPLSWKGSLGKP